MKGKDLISTAYIITEKIKIKEEKDIVIVAYTIALEFDGLIAFGTKRMCAYVS